MKNELADEIEKQLSAFELGLIYEFGGRGFGFNEIEVDLDRSIYWYKQSYEERKSEALLAVARVAFWRQERYEMGYEMYKNLLPKKISIAYLNIGVIYDLGSLGKRDIKKAGAFYKKAYELGSLRAYANYTKLRIDPASGSKLHVSFFYFVTHQFIRMRIAFIGLRDKSDIRIREA